MHLKALKHPTQCAGRNWVVVDTSVKVEDDPYAVNGHPVQWMPAEIEYYLGNEKIKHKDSVRFVARKRDAQAAIDAR